MYTVNGAYGIFQEKFKGTLKPGKLADLIVLSDDPMIIKNEDLRKIKVLFTMKSGKILFNALGGVNL